MSTEKAYTNYLLFLPKKVIFLTSIEHAYHLLIQHFPIKIKHLSRSMRFQQCAMCDQKRLRPACAYAQSYQNLC